MSSGAEHQNSILQSASLAVGTADLFFKKGNEIKFQTQANYIRRTPDEGNVIKLRKEPHSEMNVALLFCKKSLRNFQKRLDKKAKVCGRFY